MADPDLPLWGLSATIKADTVDILNFAAHHLDLGAHRLYLYLDAPDDRAFALLKAHPKIRVQLRDDAFWINKKGRVPPKHQARQSLNATHAYRRKVEVDWLIHMDVDEFLWPNETTLAHHLATLGPEIKCARVRPIESLAGDGSVYKAFMPPDGRRNAITHRIYPNFGRQVRCGFLSHVEGKLLVRTGLPDVTVKIHNIQQDDTMNPDAAELAQVDLCHQHARDWDDWLSHYKYRLSKGSYRSELAPARDPELGGMTLNALLKLIEDDQGEAGLRAFYDELCADTPDLRARLDAEGLLRIRPLRLAEKRQKQFPDFS
ncbi:glycosyltransferase family 2 protein [Aliisedimentitalea scapharcae]|uniref:Glycosyltransferase family 2 protein n=1 Tax=Aliisedimentitalea scapharcae TaxID=1524259 RepID=A0ABZ2XNY6_9RHOB